MKITIAFSLSFFLLVACNSSDGPIIKIDVDQNDKDALEVEEDNLDIEIVKPQTKEERIAEIKMMYTEFQKLEKEEPAICQEASKKYTNSDITPDMSFEFENHAKLCHMEDGFSFRKVKLNGYEWGSETTHYYKNDVLFFVFVSGGSEGWAYDQRIYYDKEGGVIRILEDENDGDGEKPTKRTDVTSVSRGGEILNDLKEATAQFDEILKGND